MSLQHTATLAAILAAVFAVCMIRIRSRISRVLADAEAGWCGAVIESQRRADLALDILDMLAQQTNGAGERSAAASSAIRAIDEAFTREEQIGLELDLDRAMDGLLADLPGEDDDGERSRAIRAYRMVCDDVGLARRYYDCAAARANAAGRTLRARAVCPSAGRSPLPMFRTTEQRRETDAAP